MNTAPEGVGYLQVRVSTAQSAIPLEGAQVIVRDHEDRSGNLISVSTSDRSGLTPTISLPTLSRSFSEVPGTAHPFYTYHIDVSKEGYYTQYYQNIPIFDGITAVQSVEMIPLPENGYEAGLTPDADHHFEGENPNL